MKSDSLTISVLFGTGVEHPEIQEAVESLPQLKLLEQTCDPERYCRQLSGNARPDVVLVEMDGQSHVPPWLERLPQEMPQTPVLLCSHTLEPEFLIRIMQVGIREFLPMPLTHDDLEAAISRVWQTKKRQSSGDRPQGKLIVVTGHKGGAGATTVAVNLAVAMPSWLRSLWPWWTWAGPSRTWRISWTWSPPITFWICVRICMNWISLSS